MSTNVPTYETGWPLFTQSHAIMVELVKSVWVNFYLTVTASMNSNLINTLAETCLILLKIQNKTTNNGRIV